MIDKVMGGCLVLSLLAVCWSGNGLYYMHEAVQIQDEMVEDIVGENYIEIGLHDGLYEYYDSNGNCAGVLYKKIEYDSLTWRTEEIIVQKINSVCGGL